MKPVIALVAFNLAISCCTQAIAGDTMNSAEGIGRVPAELMPDVRIARAKLSELGVLVPHNAETAVYQLAGHDFETVGFSFEFDHVASTFYVYLKHPDLDVFRVERQSDGVLVNGKPQVQVLFPSRSD